MFQRSSIKNSFIWILILFICFLTIYFQFRVEKCSILPKISSIKQNNDYGSSSSLKSIIFIGGMPRSGTTLMRAILDAHPMVRCGEETRIIPRILNMRSGWRKSNVEWNRLMSGGMTEDILDSAVRAFIYEVLHRHSQDSEVLCDKDPFILKYASYTSTIFSRSKFLFVIRDARAVVHSVITRQVTITGFSPTDYRQNLKLWNKGIETMHEQCEKVGPEKCLMVFYEQLVLQPKNTIEDILKFLNLPWVENVLHHEELIGNKISLSKTEHSSDQVVKPINLDALTKWIGHIPSDILAELDSLAPMLSKLGYDTKSSIPNYGAADEIVKKNMEELQNNQEFWNSKAKSYERISPNATNLFPHGSSV